MKKRYIVGGILAAPFVGVLTVAAIVGSQARADDIAACNNDDQVACDKVFKNWTTSWDKVTNPAFQARVAEHNAAKEAAQAAKEAKAQQEENRDYAIVACQAKLERSLRDPGSVRYDRSLTGYTYEDSLHKVSLVYNAKNGFGGYAGQDIYTCTFK